MNLSLSDCLYSHCNPAIPCFLKKFENCRPCIVTIDIIRKWWLIRTQQCLLNLKLATINSFETLFNEISGWNLRVWMSLVYSSWKLLNSIPKFRQTWCNLVEQIGFVVYMFQRFEREFCNISLLWPGWRHCNWCFLYRVYWQV